ncbi:helix-turn-helix domain-containing protein [Treponema sp. OMZ 805]|uniref:helix-turn-helix domain-containing protein n=1 Tax=Treponema sp. OMZ 805 TaxID=2726068 RepID=UPI003D8BCA5F
MDTCKNTLIKTADTLHLTMSEIQRLSYMLMINTDVQAFVMQNTIVQGSADIQILINAQRQLSYIKSVHPAIDSLYLYSKKSDYLLEADNAFFDIDAMYTALFAFQDLNSRQWREHYLRPVYVNAWLPESPVVSKGIRRKLLVFEQTFPLQNTAANEGKLIILLKTSYFEGLFSALPASTEAVFWLIDSKGRPLLIRPDGAVKETEPVQSEIQTMLSAMPKPMQTERSEPIIVMQQRIRGKSYFLFAQAIRGTDTVLLVSIPQFTFVQHILTGRFAVSAVFMFCLLSYIGYTAVLLLRLPRKSSSQSPLCSFQESQPEAINNPDASVGVCCSHKVVAVGFNTLCYDAERRGIKPSARINDNEHTVSADVYQGKDITLINHIAEYIEQSYANPLLNLSQMAQDFGMTENFLYYFFRTRMQKSFAQYLEDKRLEKAQALITEDTKASLTVLAERCGYANTQTFRRAFKKRYGLTPSEFKRQVFTANPTQ